MHVAQAIESRRSIRDFLPTPVAPEVIRRVLTKAMRAPSGGNLQPWHLHVVGGERLDELKAIMKRRVAEAPQGDGDNEYDIYPPSLFSPYRERRYAVGESMYALLGVGREQRDKRLAWLTRNYQCFGAPLALFCSLDRRLGRPQWSDMGMLLQTIMLLLRAEGLDSCSQEAWSTYHKTVRSFLSLPDEHIFFCGMAIGHANPDAPVNRLVTERASLDETVTFLGI
ncbi:MAG: nitroreductase [Burkholderiaceae bacterium]